MGRKATGRTTKLVRVPVQFEEQVKAYIRQLKLQQAPGTNADSCAR